MKRIVETCFVVLVSGLLFVGPVVSQEANLVIDKTVFAPGEAIEVLFTAPPGFANNAWVGIIPSNVPHGDEVVNDRRDIAYEYLKGQISGLLVFRAPETAGNFDLRMHDSDSRGSEVAFVSFTVLK